MIHLDPGWLFEAAGSPDGFRVATEIEMKALPNGEVIHDFALRHDDARPQSGGIYCQDVFGATSAQHGEDQAAFLKALYESDLIDPDEDVASQFGQISLPGRFLHPLVWTRRREALAAMGPWDVPELTALVDGDLVYDLELLEAVPEDEAWAYEHGLTAVFRAYAEFDWLFIDRVMVTPAATRPIRIQPDGTSKSPVSEGYSRVLSEVAYLTKSLLYFSPASRIAEAQRSLFEALCALYDNSRLVVPVRDAHNVPITSLTDLTKHQIGDPYADEMTRRQLTALRAYEALGLVAR